MLEQDKGRQPSLKMWLLSLFGLFLLVAAVVSLSGPGRLDILDGYPRYEVGRSLVEHGDVIVRNDEVSFCVLPGRNGQRYSSYRLPQSVAAVPALWLADATGPCTEERRQFFFVLIGAAACGILAVFYALWFRELGQSPASAIGWAVAGIFCTPNWFYGTSVFDDILGSATVVASLVLAWFGRRRWPRLFAFLAGLAVGAAFNCKQPLGLFVLPVLATTVRPDESWRQSWPRIALVLAGLSVGLLIYEGYEWYKFPPGSTEEHARLLKDYVPTFPGNPLAGVLGQLFSPAAGAFWYCPPLVLCLIGLPIWLRRHRLFTGALALCCGGVLIFFSCLVYFKGDPSWGPRYLTPVFAALWVFAPAAAALNRLRTGCLLALGLLVQLLALSVEPYRLYIELRLPATFYHGEPWIYFYPQCAHLLNRPREILEIVGDDGRGAEVFSPCHRPTEPPPFLHCMDRGPAAVRKYHFLNSFRPWWVSQRYLPLEQRPIALGETVLLLVAVAAVGVVCMSLGLWRWPRRSSGRFLASQRKCEPSSQAVQK